MQGKNNMHQQTGKLKLNTHSGFTFLELITVLAILAVLLSWGVPSLTHSIRNNSVLAQGNELIAILHLAKSEALRRNTDVRIDFTSSADGWGATIDDPAEEADVEGCVPGQLRCVNHTSATLTSVAELNFNNRGYIRAEDDVWTPEALFVQHTQCEGNNQRRRINITATGQISSCALPCDSTAACQ